MRACNNVRLPGERIPFLIGEASVGWVTVQFASVLAGMADVEWGNGRVALHNPVALPAIAQELSQRGLFRFRGEAFDVRAAPDGAVLTQIDRGAIPSFGIQAVGVHVNGLVRRADGLHLWVARRAKDKLLDPGKLDNVVAGGVPAGLGPFQTLIKEAGEEASIESEVASSAVCVGRISYEMERREGLRRDLLYCYDLTLPEQFTPVGADGEVEGFELWPIGDVVRTVRETDQFKFNVNLVLIDLFIRIGLIAEPEAGSLRAGLSVTASPL